MIRGRQRHVIIAWLIFFLTPLFWPKTIDSYLAMDFLAFAGGLLAAAMMVEEKNHSTFSWPWIFLLLFFVPILAQLLFLDVRNPWKTWQMALYLAASWLIFQYARSGAKDLLGSRAWLVMLGSIGNFYVVFALLQDFHLYLIPGTAIFPIWQSQPTRFGGPLIQTNLESLFLVLVCAALWSRAIVDNKSLPWLFASLLPTAGIMATASRSGVITMAIAIMILILWRGDYLKNLLKLGLVLSLAAILLIYWQSGKSDLGIADVSVINRFQASGIQARLFIWDMTWRLIEQHPWLGIGAGNLISYGTEAHFSSLARHPGWASIASVLSGGHGWSHNYILQFFLDLGILGGLAILALTGLVLNRIQRFWREHRGVQDGEVQGVLGLLLIMAHGMVSVAMMQGFFLVLFALYLGAAFPDPTENNALKRTTFPVASLPFFLPAVFFLFLWGHFIVTEIQAEVAVGHPINSSEFIEPIAKGIDTPWTSRPSLEMFFANLAVLHAPPPIWVNSENMAYRLWFQHQSSLSLRYLILIAHLKDDDLAEKYWIDLFLKAYPEHRASDYFKAHADQGHEQGEPLDIWK